MTIDGRIPFCKPYAAGRELHNIAKAVALENIAGDGHFTKECSRFLESRFDIDFVLMVTSCTSALEIAAMLCDLEPGDEVIMPSFTFVSCANAVIRAGGRPVFVDVREDTLNIDESRIEDAITPRTKAVMPVHYAGVGAAMNEISDIARRHDLFVIEDAAQGVNAYHDGRALGGIGHLGCYSFHETKNFVCGEGGALCVNDPELRERAEILRDKGTNRSKFFRGEIDKYTWVDVGSSYVPSEIACAFLFGQFEAMDELSEKRARIYGWYAERLVDLAAEGLLTVPYVPDECVTNHHIFHILLPTVQIRDGLLAHLDERDIHAVFHYVPLHTSPMGRSLGYRPGELPVTESASDRLLRLPMYHELTEDDVDQVVETLGRFLVSGGVDMLEKAG